MNSYLSRGKSESFSDRGRGHPAETPNLAKRRIFEIFKSLIIQSIKQMMISNLMYKYIDNNKIIFQY